MLCHVRDLMIPWNIVFHVFDSWAVSQPTNHRKTPRKRAQENKTGSSHLLLLSFSFHFGTDGAYLSTLGIQFAFGVLQVARRSLVFWFQKLGSWTSQHIQNTSKPHRKMLFLNKQFGILTELPLRLGSVLARNVAVGAPWFGSLNGKSLPFGIPTPVEDGDATAAVKKRHIEGTSNSLAKQQFFSPKRLATEKAVMPPFIMKQVKQGGHADMLLKR